MSTVSRPDFTRVELLWIKQRIEYWIRFGRIAEDQILDRRRRRVFFAPDSIFAFVRWVSNDFGTAISRIDILRAVIPGEPYQTVPGVDPGGEILLRVHGWPKVRRVFEAIDSIDALDIDPVDASPDYWRHVHNRLAVHDRPSPYTAERHHAWMIRRKLQS